MQTYGINSFILTVTLKRIVCYSHTFQNNLGIKQKLTKYLKESCCLTSFYHFSFKYFQKKSFVREILPNCQACFGLSER